MKPSLKDIVFIHKVVTNKINRDIWMSQLVSVLKKKPIRISFSYLYRIKKGQKYLMVYNQNKDHYQPPGGVYKARNGSVAFNPEICESDYITKAPEDDFRKILKSPFSLNKFYKDFLSGKYREMTFSREFKEELISTSILDPVLFEGVTETASKVFSKTLFETGKDVVSFYHFDIVEIELSDEQATYLEDMKDFKKGKYYWVDRTDIHKNEVFMDITPNPVSVQDHKLIKIAPHAIKII